MKVLISIIAMIMSLVVVYFLVPGERFDRSAAASTNALPADLDGFLAESEGQIPDLKPGAEKTINWADEPGIKTQYSVVYVHGFSASKHESRPAADHARTRLIGQKWGGPSQMVTIAPAEGESPFGHNIIGDISAPSQTGRAVKEILTWLEHL